MIMRMIQIDSATLEILVSRCLRQEINQLGGWEITTLHGGLELGSTIYRLNGQVLTGSGLQAWSLILKAIQPDPSHDDPQGYRYWKREALAYQSGLLERLPIPMTVPTCYDVKETPDGAIWLWLEDVTGDLEHPWSIERYRTVAMQLGQFNGAYLTGQPLPIDAWITCDWLKKYLEHAAPMVKFIRQNPAHPDVRAMLPGINLALTLAFWDEYPRMMEILDQMPKVFCHQDAFERNLFIRGDQLLAIDWGYAGIAPVGTELAPLIGMAFSLAGVSSDQAKKLDQVCFDGYLEGLRQAGWKPDPRQVRTVYALTLLLRYIIGATIGELLPGALEKSTRQRWAEGIGVSTEQVTKSDPGIVSYYQSVVVEALKIMGLGCILRTLVRTGIYFLRNRREDR